MVCVQIVCCQIICFDAGGNRLRINGQPSTGVAESGEAIVIVGPYHQQGSNSSRPDMAALADAAAKNACWALHHGGKAAATNSAPVVARSDSAAMTLQLG